MLREPDAHPRPHRLFTVYPSDFLLPFDQHSVSGRLFRSTDTLQGLVLFRWRTHILVGCSARSISRVRRSVTSVTSASAPPSSG